MTMRTTKILMLALSLANAVLLVGCSRPIAVYTSGDLSTGITFKFSTRSDRKSEYLNIVEVNVQSRVQGKWVMAWRLRGKSKLNYIKYGLQHPGLAEQMPAATLKEGETYCVFISEDTWPYPPGSGISCFELNNKGEVVLANYPRGN